MKYSIIPVLVLLFGCPSQSGGALQQEFVEACLAATNIDRPICECMGRKAEAELSEDEGAFVVAALKEDQERTEELRGQLGIDGAMRAGMFMTQASSCALEQSER